MLAPLVALVLLVDVVFAAFSDAMARKQMIFMSAAAYSDEPQTCFENLAMDVTNVIPAIVNCSDSEYGGSCAGYVGLSKTNKAIVLGFRGTHGVVQLIVESEKTVFTDRLDSPIGGQVSAYFLNVFNELWELGLKQGLEAFKRKYPDYELWITGHSLGGALASIAAAQIVHDGTYSADKMQLYTFGQPRTGDSAFAAAHDKLLPNVYRVTHARDTVPHVPPLGFEDYHHHKNEIWYNNRMGDGDKFIECDEEEGENCSDTNRFDYSIMDHLYYFNIFLSNYGRINCRKA
ncbi:class 3 lipase protein [Aphelenchoides avenae]|nr:class 3 lipase protein [Aphelenchus avenae]